jgi:hypothetical protein
MSIAAILKRLDRVEAKLNPPPPPPPPPPIDEKLLIGRLQLFLAGRNHNKHVLSTRLAVIRHRKPNESGLTAYTRDVGYADEAELFRIAFNDRDEFERRHLDTLQTRDPHIIGVERTHYLPGIRRAVLKTFVEEEHFHQLLDVMCPHWDARPGLSPVRPLRPADAEPADVDDAVISDIGKSLLVLAERQAKRAGRAA